MAKEPVVYVKGRLASISVATQYNRHQASLEFTNVNVELSVPRAKVLEQKDGAVTVDLDGAVALIRGLSDRLLQMADEQAAA